MSTLGLPQGELWRQVSPRSSVHQGLRKVVCALWESGTAAGRNFPGDGPCLRRGLGPEATLLRHAEGRDGVRPVPTDRKRAPLPQPWGPDTYLVEHRWQGWSDEAESPLDGVQSAQDLHTLLATAGEHGPYVLVGHSTGGTHAMTYAARYPEQVAGMVLLDSSSPEQFTRMPAYPGVYAMLRRLYGVLPTLSRLGLGQLVPGTSHLPAADAATVNAMTSVPQAYRNQRDEVSILPEVFTQARALTTLGDRPLAVLTASATIAGTEGWDGAQDRLAGLSTNSEHRTVDSTHPGLLEDSGPAAESVRAINEVIDSVRTGGPLGPP